jgi:hypothetical protein
VARDDSGVDSGEKAGGVADDAADKAAAARTPSIRMPGTPRWPRFCQDDGVLARYLETDGFAAHMVRSTVTEAATQFEQIKVEGGESRLEVLVLNWVEQTAVQAVGAEFAAQFLHDLATC